MTLSRRGWQMLEPFEHSSIDNKTRCTGSAELSTRRDSGNRQHSGAM